MSRYLRQMGAVVRKDLIVELRTRERVIAMGAFAVLVGILFNYSLDRSLVNPRDLAAGMIWLTVIFGGLLGLGRTFRMEEENGAMDGLLLSPIPRDALYLGKVAANYLILMAVTSVVVGVFWIFFDLRLEGSAGLLLAVLALGVLSFVALGTLFSAVSVRSTMGETLLPILIFPLLVPVVIYGVSATARVFAGRPVPEVAGNLKMLGAFALVSLGAGAGLFRYVVEE